MKNYTNIIESLKCLDETTNKVFDYSIESIGYRHVVWWNQVSGITQHFYFDDNGRLYNFIIN